MRFPPAGCGIHLAFRPCPRSFQLYSTQNVRKNPRRPWHPRAAPRVTRLTPERLTRLPGTAVLTSQLTCRLTPAGPLPDDQGSRGHCQAPHAEGGSSRQVGRLLQGGGFLFLISLREPVSPLDPSTEQGDTHRSWWGPSAMRRQRQGKARGCCWGLLASVPALKPPQGHALHGRRQEFPLFF